MPFLKEEGIVLTHVNGEVYSCNISILNNTTINILNEQSIDDFKVSFNKFKDEYINKLFILIKQECKKRIESRYPSYKQRNIDRKSLQATKKNISRGIPT